MHAQQPLAPPHSESRTSCVSLLSLKRTHAHTITTDNNSSILFYRVRQKNYRPKNFGTISLMSETHTQTHTHNPFSETTRVSRYQKGKPVWILLKQETVSGSGISWAICKSAPRSRQISTPAPHHSVFYRPDGLQSCRPTNSVKALKALPNE